MKNHNKPDEPDHSNPFKTIKRFREWRNIEDDTGERLAVLILVIPIGIAYATALYIGNLLKILINVFMIVRSLEINSPISWNFYEQLVKFLDNFTFYLEVKLPDMFFRHVLIYVWKKVLPLLTFLSGTRS